MARALRALPCCKRWRTKGRAFTGGSAPARTARRPDGPRIRKRTQAERGAPDRVPLAVCHTRMRLCGDHARARPVTISSILGSIAFLLVFHDLADCPFQRFVTGFPLSQRRGI